MTENPFEDAYRTQAADGSVVVAAGWDTGEPQPVFVELERSGGITGDVLDAGCGTGENALYLAGRGHRVTGVDAAPTAIANARVKAEARGTEVEFAVADVLDLFAYDARFDTVIDSGLFHVFPDADQRRYLAALHGACRPGATLYALTFSELQPGEWGPRRLSEADIHAVVTGTWEVRDLRRATMASARAGVGPEDIHAWLLTAHRVP